MLDPITATTDKKNTFPVNPVTPSDLPRQKKRKNLSISNVAGARTYMIENEQDIDQFLAEMKRNLLNELEDDTIITLS